mmetsp:Transcript_8234/g.15281  ORF Transcript_8234/g.15281 Transcript_8234/m.15281 type:complete len:215 (-) Transcript_8234:391-1035(-)
MTSSKTFDLSRFRTKSAITSDFRGSWDFFSSPEIGRYTFLLKSAYDWFGVFRAESLSKPHSDIFEMSEAPRVWRSLCSGGTNIMCPEFHCSFERLFRCRDFRLGFVSWSLSAFMIFSTLSASGRSLSVTLTKNSLAFFFFPLTSHPCTNRVPLLFVSFTLCSLRRVPSGFSGAIEKSSAMDKVHFPTNSGSELKNFASINFESHRISNVRGSSF